MGYQLLWESKSHLFACTVTSLAYSRYAADYNYLESFAMPYSDKHLAFYIGVDSLTKRIERTRQFFSQKANLNFYFQECSNLKLSYSAFYNSLQADYSNATNGEIASLFSTLLHLQARCASLYQGTHEYATSHFHDELVKEVKKVTGNWQEAVLAITVSTPPEIKREEADYSILVSASDPDWLGHVKKYPWVCAKAFFLDEAVEELKQLAQTRQPRGEKNKTRGFEEILKGERISNLANVLKKFSELRVDIKALLQSKMLGSELYREIANRMKIEPTKLFYTVDADEVLKFLHTGEMEAYAGERLYISRGANFEMKTEESAATFNAALKTQKTMIEVKGTAVQMGKATGIARVILPTRLAELTNATFNEGDVLVTSMTNPNMIFLASKASAIVTDEGGITCHAAIISRELKKPCIVGTRNATKMIKDGDKIEVDADNGTVKLLTP